MNLRLSDNKTKEGQVICRVFGNPGPTLRNPFNTYLVKPRMQDNTWVGVVLLLLLLASCSEAFTVSLELQGDCSDQLTLTCRHSETGMAPLWIHNGTVEGGQVLDTAFPGAMYTVLSRTEHTTTITGVDNVRALDGCSFQCAYDDLGNRIKSKAVLFSFIPPDYKPALSLVSFTSDFSERLSTFTYSYQESCSLYPRCTPYFSVEHTVSPQSVVRNSFSGCSEEYTIRNLMRCVSYQSTATTRLRSQRGIPIVVEDTVMLSPGPFTITDVSIGADRNLTNVTYKENEPDCPSYPTERYTVDVDGVQVADLTADAVQSLAINHASGSVTLFLHLSQPLPENAVTLNMTKYNTVPTNRSDITGNIVTEMVTWGTSAVFALGESPPGGETPTPGNDVAIGVSVPVGIVVIAGGGGVTAVIVVVIIKWRNKKKEERSEGSHQQMSTVNPQVEETENHDDNATGSTSELLPLETPMDKHKLVKGVVRQLPMQPEEAQEAGMHATERQHYAELDFADRRPIPAPTSDKFVVAYAEVSQA